MLICIDSCVFIRGTIRQEADTRQLFALIGPRVQLVIPRIVAIETTRNLTWASQRTSFYRLFHKNDSASIIDVPIPSVLIERYIALGLAEKGDAVIGAFAEWMHVDYLISDNRHFLQQVRTDAYRLVTPAEFLAAITPT